MKHLASPVTEKVNIRPQVIGLRVQMELAGVKVALLGSYHIDTNVYDPITVTEIGSSGYPLEIRGADLESYCTTMGWDYFDTLMAIKAAVEKR